MTLSGRSFGMLRRLSHVAPVVMGAALALVTLLALGGLGWYEFEETLDSDRQLGTLQARVLEDHASRSVEATAVTLNYLAGQLATTDLLGGYTRADQIMSQPMIALPFVRGLHLLDVKGVVLASSAPDQVGVKVALERLGELPPTGQDRLGGFIPGRGLADLALGKAVVPAASGVGFFPLVRALRVHEDQTLYLVALLNADSFSSFQLATLNNPKDAAYLLSYQGELLASSVPQGPSPGARLATHNVFTDYLPGKEHASYVGQGVLPERQVVAFRVSRSRPLVVIVEKPFAESLRRWFVAVRWFGVVGFLTLVFILFMSFAVQRNAQERRRAYAQLIAARADVVHREHELRVLVKSVQELIFRTNLAGEIVYVNDRWTALRGQSVDDAVGHALMALVEPQERDSVAALFSTESDAGVRAATAQMRSSDGKLHRFDFAVVPLRDASGITAFAGSAVDVTERVEAQQALQRQLAFVALMLEINPLPVATFDRQGRYVSVNRAWEDFFGRSRADVVGHRGAHFMSTEDAAMHAARDAELWRIGGSLRYEAKVLHRDGTRHDVVVTKVAVVGEDAQSSRLLSTMMDVSEFREAERATREAKEAAEESSRAKSEFTANISHELRTPLQSILGFSELGVARAGDHPRLQNMFQEIQDSGERMLALVNNLLDISKIESAIGAITLERADLRGLIYPVLRELQPLLDAKRLYLATDLGDVPLIAKVDPVRFQQVIRNVTANAIKFSPPDAAIEVMGEVTTDRHICIGIRDHGGGIPPAELESIFEAFVQSSSTKDGAGGTGLGLAICRKIVDAHGGYIQADNMRDGGAIFRIFLPLRQHLDQDTNF